MTQENKESIAKAPSGRVKRTPVSGRNVLTVQGKDPNYMYRIVNDDEDRITRFLEGGYELVSDDSVKVGDKRVGNASSMGNSVKELSVGGGKKAVVMRIKREWYEEDQKAKQDFVNQQESTTKQKALSGTYGTLVYDGKEYKGSDDPSHR